ncbi:MAG: ATP-binding protein [Prevotella sp.]|jgi:predicted AAA+ superfamily ATPase
MRRKIYDRLKRWKEEEQGRTAVLLTGARRVGKSYIVKEFGKNEYKSYILIDFFSASDDVKALFDNYLDDLDTFFTYLSAYTNTTLERRNSLIIFDEVEMFPKARAAIKYLVEDGRYDYIETGSLVSIRKNVENILIPSEEEEIKMYPMDFEEFLWAMGNDTLMPFIGNCFDKRQSLGPLHRKAMDYFRQYLIVGGMPQVVATYVERRDFKVVDKQKRGIVSLYRNDIQKYATGYENKVTQIFDALPSQLQRHEKRFQMSALEKGARFRDYETAFFWLQDSMVCNFAYNTTEPNIGLGLNSERNTLKCYLGDTGLLISMAFNENDIVSENLYQKILTDKLEFNGGMLIENVVAQMLRAAGHQLYFYSKYEKGNAEETMEVDFLIAKHSITSRHNITPIEVKSSLRYTFTSLKKMMAKYKEYLSQPIIVHTADLQEKDGYLFLPVYMVPLL